MIIEARGATCCLFAMIICCAASRFIAKIAMPIHTYMRDYYAEIIAGDAFRHIKSCRCLRFAFAYAYFATITLFHARVTPA